MKHRASPVTGTTMPRSLPQTERKQTMNKTDQNPTENKKMPVVNRQPEGKHQFWMVYVGGMDQPKMKYPTLAEAVQNATHLCRKNRDRKVYVLESIGIVMPEWVDIRDKQNLAKHVAPTSTLREA